MTDQTNCCIDDGLKSVQELCRKADQQRITVIKLCQHRTGDERHNSMTRQRPLDAPQLAQDAETACSSSGDVCRHGRISVQVNAEVSNGADRRNVVGTDTERYGGNLVNASTRRTPVTPHHFSLCGVQLQAVASHPRRYVGLYDRSCTSVCRPRTDGLEGCARPPVG